MKKYLYLIVFSMFTLGFVSCEPNSLADEEIFEQTESTGHGEVGDPGSGDEEEEEVGG